MRQKITPLASPGYAWPRHRAGDGEMTPGMALEDLWS
jgi:hypothetical protein